MNNDKVVIAGGSGFVGVSLAHHLLQSKFKVTILSRNRPKVDGQWDFVKWDARTLGDWQSVIDGAAAVVNLVGRTVAEVEQDLILETLTHCLGNRTHAAHILGISIRTLRNKLKQYSDEGLRIIPPPTGQAA